IFEIRKRKMTGEQIDNYAFNYVTRWARKIIKMTGSTVKIEGLENVPEGPCLFVSNHQEYFDILVMIGYIPKPKGFIAKKELEKVPAVSYWMKQIHCVFIDRDNQRESLKAILEGIDNLKSGYSMHIAPEGTRSKGPTLGEFKRGSLKLAVKTEVPVIPVTLNNVYKITEGKGFLDLKAVEMEMTISSPIDTKNLTREEQYDLSERVREVIFSNLKTT
ncbi:MAG: lysophospholipid acyltransferase family protein, partial [Bacillota bacterium]|nr:lysophospholipid acyltransferase family protein [Bacillota bacterium]